MSRYACREHPDEMVDWRGGGCTRCADESEQWNREDKPPGPFGIRTFDEHQLAADVFREHQDDQR